MRAPLSESRIQTLNESYPAVPEAVPRARRRLGGFARRAGASGDQLDGIMLSVSEAVTNTVQHAYEGARGDVHLTAAVVSGELWVLIADDGCGLAARRNSPGLGLGLACMAQFSDGLTLISRAGRGLEVRLRFELLGRAPDEGEARAPAGGKLAEAR